MKIQLQIHQSIFSNSPTFRRGIVVANNIHNQDTSPELEDMLNQAITQASKKPTDFNTDSRIVVWDTAHRQFGSNPNKFPPAHRNLLKRVQKNGAQIPFINKVVAIMNINSITDVMPVGGDDLILTGQCLELRYANGSETFIPLGSPEIVEHPDPGEIIYVVAESGQVMCRRWNWRNAHRTRITEDSHTIVINIDGLGEDSEARTLVTRDRVAKMLAEFCQADVTTTLLSSFQPSYEFSI
jgi:DNA/RNA-binding domain of Phe-tRNA-synthetase-like protein